MTKTIKFLVGLYLVSAVGALALFATNAGTNTNLTKELAATKNELATAKNTLESHVAERAILDKKVAEARANAAFLSFALCPALESANANALCIKNSTEWFSQTVQAGTLITDPDTKIKMDMLLVSLGSKKQPTAKQFYEMLKPVEVNSLRAIAENLK